MEVCTSFTCNLHLLDVYNRGFSTLGLIVHDISRRSQVLHVEGAHKGKVSGICFADGERILSCGVDRNVKLWDIRPSQDIDENTAGPSVCLLMLC